MPKPLKTLLGFTVGFGVGLILLWMAPTGSYRALAADKGSGGSTGYQVTEWIDLIPKEDLDALLNPPTALDRIVDGSAADSLDNLEESSGNSRYSQALRSMRIIPEYNDKKIRIPGFVVPIESDNDQRITSFFLVPYFGACLHFPPPPPNQIIYATYPEGLQVEVLYNPFWLEGTVKTEVTDTIYGTSAYTMIVDRIEDYEE